jgi:hypothetical protein
MFDIHTSVGYHGVTSLPDPTCTEVTLLSRELAQIMGERFIQRTDVKAIQFQSGAYVPDNYADLRNPAPYQPLGWLGRHVLAHIEGKHSYGHYMLDENSMVKLFAFDIDLEKKGTWVEHPKWEEGISDEDFDSETKIHLCNPRELWADRSALAARAWFKWQMSQLAHMFCSVIKDQLKLPCAAAYSGSKGIHVYGFTGPIPAQEAREGALLVLDILGQFEPLRGENFFRHKEGGTMGFPSFSIEVFPKQTSIENKDGYGNLMRLPLGRNLKSSDPTFFLDLTAPLAQLKPHPDPVRLLTTGEPYL